MNINYLFQGFKSGMNNVEIEKILREVAEDKEQWLNEDQYKAAGRFRRLVNDSPTSCSQVCFYTYY